MSHNPADSKGDNAMTRHCLIASACVLFSGSASADATYVWKAKVVDWVSNEAVPGASIDFNFVDVRAKNSSTGNCLTDANGECSVSSVGTGNIFSSSAVKATFTVAREGFDPGFKFDSKKLSNTELAMTVHILKLQKHVASVSGYFGDAVSGASVTFVSANKKTFHCQTDDSGICSIDGPQSMESVRAERSGVRSGTESGIRGAWKLLMPTSESLAKLRAAEGQAFWMCAGKPACDQAFSLAQIYLNSKSDQKIQFANDTIVETFNPTAEGSVAMRITREPISTTDSKIALSVTCKESELALQLCALKRYEILSTFPTWMSQRLGGRPR